MTSALFLAAAIGSEVTATLALRVQAVGGDRRWLAVIVPGYLAAFGFLALALADGLAVGVAYGIWAATGVALTALAGRVLFGDRLGRRMLAGIACIIVGVLLIELGAHG